MKYIRWVNLAFIFCALLLSGCNHMTTAMPDDPRFKPIIPIPKMASAPKTGSLVNPDDNYSLYTDKRASKLGDLITVKLVEKATSTKDTSVNTKKEFKNETANPTIWGSNPSFKLLNKLPFFRSENRDTFQNSISSVNESKGSGDSTQNNQLNAEITVTISQILPNGNFVIRGEKWLELTNGDDFLRISGIIRPDDIQPDNTVMSNKIADARITFKGRGAIQNANELGWIAKFFNSPFYPL